MLNDAGLSVTPRTSARELSHERWWNRPKNHSYNESARAREPAGALLQPDRTSECPPLEVVRWLLREAESGSQEAMLELSICYLTGYGVPVSLARSQSWAGKCERSFEAGPCAPSETTSGCILLKCCRDDK
ncbi:MAG: hypothetical protein JWN04_4985 [Myxococcaceae bacterium]|nr:hypothetical protein [Myxococcaceae bacterium]